MDYIRAAISIKSASVPSLSRGHLEWPRRVRFSHILDNSGVALSCISRRPGSRLLLKAMANSIAGQLESLKAIGNYRTAGAQTAANTTNYVIPNFEKPYK